MITEFKSNGKYANSFVICRFHECVIVNPSHSYEEIASFVGAKKIVGLLVTEVLKQTIDQIGYYNAPLYLSKWQEEAITRGFIPGYDDHEKAFPFDLRKIDIITYNHMEKIKLGESYLETIIIDGLSNPTTVFRFNKSLFVGGLFTNNKLAKKANYKSSIYDLKKSIQTVIYLEGDFTLYHSAREPNKLANEKITNPDLKRWV